MRVFLLPIIGLCGCFISAKDLYLGSDQDGDGWHHESAGYETPPDCDDSNAAIHPDAPEVCDGIDNNCDGIIDDGDDRLVIYPDQDGDGVGLSGYDKRACEAPEGWTAVAGDCNDQAAETYPGAREHCDGLDNDCDGERDEGLEHQTWYADQDGDGFGDAQTTIQTCAPPPGYVADFSDCDDGDATIHPDAEENWYDGVDQNCDNADDFDRDGDGAQEGEDCDDNDPLRSPYYDEVCNDGIDNNCDDSATPCELIGQVDVESSSVGSLTGPSYSHLAFATYTANVGDMTADGHDDLIVSSLTSLRRYYHLVPGPVTQNTRVDFLSHHRFSSPTGADITGDVVGGCDFNGDGHHDLAFLGESKVWVGYGPFSTYENIVDYYYIHSGTLSLSSIACVGDTDGNGMDELAIGMPDTDPGWVFLYEGTLTANLPILFSGHPIFDQSHTTTAFGDTVRGIPDFDGDGLPDIVVESPGINHRNGPVTLIADPLSINDSNDANTVVMLDDTEGDGEFWVTMGRVNPDPDLDLIVYSAATDDIRVLYGPFVSQADTLYPNIVIRDLNGQRVLASGDLNGDGDPDLILDGSVVYGPIATTQSIDEYFAVGSGAELTGSTRTMLHNVAGGGQLIIAQTPSSSSQLYMLEFGGL